MTIVQKGKANIVYKIRKQQTIQLLWTVKTVTSCHAMTHLITPDFNIPVCNWLIPFNGELIWGQSSTPDPRRSGRAWNLE